MSASSTLGVLSVFLLTAFAAEATSQKFRRLQISQTRFSDIPEVAAGPSENGVGKAQGVSDLEHIPIAGEAFKVHPVSTTMKCVISLTIQYLLVYTALALVRTGADSFNIKYDNLPIQKILVSASLTVVYAPMMAVLFLGCRMRVLYLTRGQENPPLWVQLCMYFCTYSLLVLTLVVCIIPVFTGETLGVDPRTGDLRPDVEPFEHWLAAYGFIMLKYLILLGLYLGVLCVVYGTLTYKPPTGITPLGIELPVSPAVECVTILSCMYFVVYAGVQFARTFTQLSKVPMTKFENAMLTATNCMNFAPMLGILFLAARMRALQMDPVNGNPQRSAVICFYMCTYSLLVQTCLSIAVPLVMQGSVKMGKVEGDMEYEVENKMLGTSLIVARYIMMFCIYIGFSCVIWSIFALQHPNGPEYTPPVSVTMQCVMNLTCQFFAVYLIIWIGVTAKELTGKEFPLVTQTMENAKATIQFCPMLAILFVGTRMRALQMTDNRGAPQGWVQDGMYMSTWAVLLQFLMCVFTPVFTGSPGQCDEDGHPVWAPENKVGFYVVSGLKWLSYLFLYGGIIAVMIGVFTMTPETANGQGSIPLVGDGEVPGTDVRVPGYDGVKEPYGVNDIPGVPSF